MRVHIQVSTGLRGRQVRVQGLPAGVSVPDQLVIGGRSAQVRAMKGRGPKETTLVVSNGLAKAFGLLHNTQLYVRASGSTWRLGPVLGVYVDRVASNDRPFGEQTVMLEELTTYGQHLGVYVVVLTPGAVRDRTAMHFNSAQKTWTTTQNITADIVLRRSGTFAKQNARAARNDLAIVQSQGKLHTLPRNSSDKWTLYQLLSNNGTLRTHLPHTVLCTSGADLFRLAKNRADVYLKPPGGAQGVSIYHLQKKQNQFMATWERRVVPRNQDRVSNDFNPETKLMQSAIRTEADFIRFWRHTKLTRCIVQDTVQLPTVDGSPFDFRWLVVSSDTPQVVARVARIGQKQAITTNIHTGGTAKPAEHMVALAVGKDAKDEYLKQMDDLAVAVVTELARRYGPFAEVGIDFALTPSGDIYIFEINPTPGRRMLRMLSGDTRRLSLEALLEYAIRATGYRG